MTNKNTQKENLDSSKVKYTSDIAILTGFDTVEKALDYLNRKDFNNDFNKEF